MSGACASCQNSGQLRVVRCWQRLSSQRPKFIASKRNKSLWPKIQESAGLRSFWGLRGDAVRACARPPALRTTQDTVPIPRPTT